MAAFIAIICKLQTKQPLLQTSEKKMLSSLYGIRLLTIGQAASVTKYVN